MNKKPVGISNFSLFYEGWLGLFDSLIQIFSFGFFQSDFQLIAGEKRLRKALEKIKKQRQDNLVS